MNNKTHGIPRGGLKRILVHGDRLHMMLIAFEGIDGCGKGTQTAELARRASSRGLSVATFSFPRYGDNAFSHAIARYLNGEFGGVGDVPAEFAALLYAGDRLAARDELRQACRDHDLVICDRYVPSNLAHQAAKIAPPDRAAFLQWLSEIEYKIHDMPKADLLFYLDLPVQDATNLVQRKSQRAYTLRKADIHEADPSYLNACKSVYDSLVEADRAPWIAVQCLDDSGQLRSVSELADVVWAQVAPHLPSQAARGHRQ